MQIVQPALVCSRKGGQDVANTSEMHLTPEFNSLWCFYHLSFITEERKWLECTRLCEEIPRFKIDRFWMQSGKSEPLIGVEHNCTSLDSRFHSHTLQSICYCCKALMLLSTLSYWLVATNCVQNTRKSPERMRFFARDTSLEALSILWPFLVPLSVGSEFWNQTQHSWKTGCITCLRWGEKAKQHLKKEVRSSSSKKFCKWQDLYPALPIPYSILLPHGHWPT